MHGYIDDTLVPRIQDVFIVGKTKLIPIEPVLDTGFNDEFTLPRHHFNEYDLEFFGKEEYILANGDLIEEDVYLGELIIDNKRINVFVSLTNDVDALIGTRLLDNTITVLDFKNYNITVQA